MKVWRTLSNTHSVGGFDCGQCDNCQRQWFMKNKSRTKSEIEVAVGS